MFMERKQTTTICKHIKNIVICLEYVNELSKNTSNMIKLPSTIFLISIALEKICVTSFYKKSILKSKWKEKLRESLSLEQQI